MFIDSFFLSIHSSVHLFILNPYLLLFTFSVFLMVSPFLETSELQKNVQELERNISALRDYSVGVVLNH